MSRSPINQPHFSVAKKSILRRIHIQFGYLEKVFNFKNSINLDLKTFLIGDGGQTTQGEEYRATPILVEQLDGKRFIGGSASWLYTMLVTGE